jgi:transposase
VVVQQALPHHDLADTPRHSSPWAAKVYADAIARGHDYPHAIRV